MNFQTEIIKEYESKGFTVLKIIRLNKSGYPDLMCLKNGKVIFIEVKEEKDTLKELQKKRIEDLRKLGFKTFCIQKNKGKIF